MLCITSRGHPNDQPKIIYLDYMLFFHTFWIWSDVVVLIFSIPVMPLIHLLDDMCYQQDIHALGINGLIGNFQ